VGDQVKVGQVFCVIEAGAAGKKEKPARAEQGAKVAAVGRQGAGPGEPTVEQRSDEPAPRERPKEEPPPREQPSRKPPAARPAPQAEPAAARAGNGQAVFAGPATRRLARELGIDLRQVAGSGRNGRVTQDDVKEYVKQLAS